MRIKVDSASCTLAYQHQLAFEIHCSPFRRNSFRPLCSAPAGALQALSPTSLDTL